MERKFKYYAFLSYSHRDEEWAKWLQHEFEHYHLPSTLNGVADLNRRFRPVFRDIDELSGGELQPQISEALSESANLIIICSPNSAKSRYVNDEVREFLAIGREREEDYMGRIFPFIIAGEPHSAHKEMECFPEALLELSAELIAGDAVRHGREHAFVKILAGTLRSSHVDFSMLWDRFERDRIEEERRKREERDRLLMVQSRYLAEKSLALLNDGESYMARLLALAALPKDVDNPDRPYCPEAEYALRQASQREGFLLNTPENVVLAKFSDDGKYILTLEEGEGISNLSVWDRASGGLISRLESKGIQRFCDLDVKRLRIVANHGNEVTVRNMCTGEVVWSGGYEANNVEFSADGRYLAIYDGKRYLRVYEAESYGLLWETEVEATAYCRAEFLHFSRSGKSLLFGLRIDEVSEFDTRTGSLIYDGPTLSAFPNHSTAKRRKNCLAHRLQTLTSESRVVKRLLSDSSYFPTIALSPDMRFLASAYHVDGRGGVTGSEVAVYEVSSGKLLCTLKGHTGKVASVNWSPDGNQLVSASNDKTVRIWDLDNFLSCDPTPVHRHLICDLKYDDTGRYICTEAYDDSIVYWDARSGKRISDPSVIHKLTESMADKPSIVKINGSSVSYYLEDVECTCVYRDPDGFKICKSAISGDGRYVAVGYAKGMIKIFDGEYFSLEKELNRIYHDEEGKHIVQEATDLEDGDYISPVVALEFSPDSKRLLSVWRNGRCCVWNLRTGQYKDFPEPNYWIYSAHFSADGRDILLVGRDYRDYELFLWNWRTGKVRRRNIVVGETFDAIFDPVRPHVKAAEYSPDGASIAMSVNNYLRFYDPLTLADRKLLRGHECKVIALFFTEDDKYLVSQSNDSAVCIWDTVTYRQVDVFVGSITDFEEMRVDYECGVLKYCNEDYLLPLNGVREEGESLPESISPDGRYQAVAEDGSARESGTIRGNVAVYDRDSGVKVCSLQEPKSGLTCLTFSHDGKKIAAAYKDGSVRIWRFPSLKRLISTTAGRFKSRPLTRAEKDAYYL